MKERSLEETSELLRMALPMMAKHTIPVTPENYSVWYEYVAGDNQALTDRMDQILSNDEEINEEVIVAIRKGYLDSNAELERSEKAQQSLLELTESMEKCLEHACGEADDYEKSLESYQGKITDGIQVEQLAFLIGELSESTKNMNSQNKEIIKNLEETQRETEKLRVELQQVKKEAKTDTLTSLANRAAFYECLDEMESSGELEAGTHCLLMADIDKFKLINDTYGHIFGDKVIKAVAQTLQHNTKGKDLPVRFGGEEFIVLLPETDIHGAQTVAESIRRTLESARIRNPKTGKSMAKLTISIGVAQLKHGVEIETIISNADEALYRAKENGRNRVEVYL